MWPCGPSSFDLQEKVNKAIERGDNAETAVCKLKDNPLGFTSVGYPTDELHIPQWFKELPFDDALMEITIVDQKVENLLGVLAWDIPSHTDIATTFDSLFSFD